MELTCFVLVMSLLCPWLVSAFLLLGLPAIAAPPSGGWCPARPRSTTRGLATAAAS